MNDKQFELFMEVMDKIEDHLASLRYDGISSGSFSANRMSEFMKYLGRMATALEENDMTIKDRDRSEDPELKSLIQKVLDSIAALQKELEQVREEDDEL